MFNSEGVPLYVEKSCKMSFVTSQGELIKRHVASSEAQNGSKLLFSHMQ